MKKEIVIRIPPNGNNIEIDQKGMVGKECGDNIKNLIDKLGKKVESKKKQEYYRRTEDVQIDVKR